MTEDIPALLKYSDEEYLSIVDFLHEVADALTGKVSPDGRKVDSQNLALKLIYHAISAFKLTKDEEIELALTGRKTSFIDFSSIAAIGRAALETYLTFYEIFVAPKSDDEFEFNYCLWYLSDYELFEGVRNVDDTLKAEHEDVLNILEQFRDRIKSTATFKTLSKKGRGAVLKGIRKRDWGKTLRGAKLGPSVFRTQFKYSSGFTHAGGLTTNQVMSIKTKEEQKDFAETELQKIMIYMCKFISDYVNLHPECQQAANKYPKLLERINFWDSAVSGMP